jgi:hypothetical protein
MWRLIYALVAVGCILLAVAYMIDDMRYCLQAGEAAGKVASIEVSRNYNSMSGTWTESRVVKVAFSAGNHSYVCASDSFMIWMGFGEVGDDVVVLYDRQKPSSWRPGPMAKRMGVDLLQVLALCGLFAFAFMLVRYSTRATGQRFFDD